MTHRSEFLPAENPLVNNYKALIEAGELVIRYRCDNCAYPDPDRHCIGCAYSPLRQTLERIRNVKQKSGDGLG
jgi:hypothetical protein